MDRKILIVNEDTGKLRRVKLQDLISSDLGYKEPLEKYKSHFGEVYFIDDETGIYVNRGFFGIKKENQSKFTKEAELLVYSRHDDGALYLGILYMGKPNFARFSLSCNMYMGDGNMKLAYYPKNTIRAPEGKFINMPNFTSCEMDITRLIGKIEQEDKLIRETFTSMFEKAHYYFLDDVLD